jgi:hypothetical protein
MSHLGTARTNQTTLHMNCFSPGILGCRSDSVAAERGRSTDRVKYRFQPTLLRDGQFPPQPVPTTPSCPEPSHPFDVLILNWKAGAATRTQTGRDLPQFSPVRLEQDRYEGHQDSFVVAELARSPTQIRALASSTWPSLVLVFRHCVWSPADGSRSGAELGPVRSSRGRQLDTSRRPCSGRPSKPTMI